MMRLDDREWKPCRLSSLGTVESGRDIYALERVDGDIPYITSGSQNNGIGYLVNSKNDTYDKGYIAFNRNGAVGLAFYHPYWSVMGNDCRKLHLTDADENIYVGIFVATAISMQSKSFSYSRKLGTGRANKLQIMLPVTDAGEPDFQFMEDYACELMAAKRKQYQQFVEKRLESLELDMANMTGYSKAPKSCQWKPVPIVSLFDRFEPGKGKGLNHLEQSEQGITYIGATNRNNGIMCYVKDNGTARKMMQEGNCIGFIKNGDGSAGYAIYKQEPFISTSDVIYGYAKWLNLYTGLFFVAAQDMIEHKYSHGYKRNAQHLKGDRVMLPVTDDGQPDYDFMELFGRKMMSNKYRQYLSFLSLPATTI